MQSERKPLHRGNRRLRAMLLALCLLLMMGIASTAAAIDPIRDTQTTLTVEFSVSGMTFKLYRVADMDEFGACTLVSRFPEDSICPDRKVPTDMDSASEWDALAQTLSSYIASDAGFAPIRAGQIGSDHTLTFSRLSVGLYLLVGVPYTSGSTTYYTQPALITLPGRCENDKWLYHVDVQPKWDCETESGGGGGGSSYIDLQVIKIWKDNCYSGRPVSITVDLVKDGVIIRSAVLCSANNWKYTWEDVPNDKGLKVVERDVPDGYTVRICREKTWRVVVTNTRPGTTTTITKLPQTGQLWWPVPLLAGAGMVLFVIGWLRRRRYEEEK